MQFLKRIKSFLKRVKGYLKRKLKAVKKKLKKKKNKIKKEAKRIYRVFWYKFFLVLRYLPLKRETVVFESFLGKKYNDSPRAMYEYMKERYPDLDYVWIVTDPKKFDIPDARLVKRLTPKYFILVARAKYLVNNSRMPIFFKKRDEQVYIQTWHGTPLKKLVFDMENNVMPGTNPQKYLNNFSNEVKNWDYLISPNHYSTEKFTSAFKFDNQFLEYGYPRNEILHNYTPQMRKQFREKYGIKDDEIAVLYTPTYRDSKNKGKAKYYQEMKLDLEQLNSTPGVKVLLRLHYLISKNINVSKYENIINVSKENDVNELYIASDVLLNDYSSTMFDYLILNKPIILFPYDLAEYAGEIRGFYMDYNDLPAEQIETTERLIEIVTNLSGYNSVWKEELEKFRDEMVLPTEADATKHIMEYIFEKHPIAENSKKAK